MKGKAKHLTVPLEDRSHKWPPGYGKRARCLEKGPPFYKSRAGHLVHRVRVLIEFTNDLGNVSHTGVGTFCDQIGSDTKGDLMSEPPEDELLCARCEAIARAKGLPSADQIVGRHCHTGAIKVFKNCCRSEDQN